MIIKSIEVENWKCFYGKRKFNFKNHELITMRNGTGKTSIFEAIIFAIYGKTPVGFNMNTVRNNDKEQCRIFIEFTLNGKDCTIERVFGSSNPIAELIIDGNLVCESVRTIEEYMNSIINYKITSQLWTASLIDSDITSVGFFTKNILEDALSDPLRLIAKYKSDAYYHNKRINAFNEKILDAEAIKNEMEAIKSNLKDRNDVSNAKLNMANNAKDAYAFIQSFEETWKSLESKGISLDACRNYIKLLPMKIKLEESLKMEIQKRDSPFSKFNHSEIKRIMDASISSNRCIICGGDFDKSHYEELSRELSLSGRSESKIKELNDQLNAIKIFDGFDDGLSIAKNAVKYAEAKVTLEKCPNWLEIIDSFNEENSKLWEKFDMIQRKYALALKQQEELAEINAMKISLEEIRKKLDVLNQWVSDANVYYTNRIMEKASQYLSNINGRYKQISIYEGSFHIVVEQEDFALNLLPIARLSNGEKTLCALSILFAIHNIMVPELPLLFDETFSALDRENLEQVQLFLRKQDTQIFVITHDKNWQEF